MTKPRLLFRFDVIRTAVADAACVDGLDFALDHQSVETRVEIGKTADWKRMGAKRAVRLELLTLVHAHRGEFTVEEFEDRVQGGRIGLERFLEPFHEKMVKLAHILRTYRLSLLGIVGTVLLTC